MSDQIHVAFAGLDVIQQRLDALGHADTLARRVASKQTQEGERIMVVAKLRTPVRHGVLRSTGHVEIPVVAGNTIETTLGFGGPAAGYAIYVHENLTARHRVGQAKFLESAFNEWLAANGMQRIADDIGAYFAEVANTGRGSPEAPGT